MIDGGIVHEKRHGTVASFVMTHSIDRQRELRHANLLKDGVNHDRVSRMPNGDPPSIMLWGLDSKGDD